MNTFGNNISTYGFCLILGTEKNSSTYQDVWCGTGKKLAFQFDVYDNTLRFIFN